MSAARNKKRCLLVVSAYVPTNSTDVLVKDEFYSQLCTLLGKVKSSDIIVLEEMNARARQLEEGKLNFGGWYSLEKTRSNNGD